MIQDWGGELLGGGALAIIVIREVLNFLQDKKDIGNGKKLAGDQPVEFWNQQFNAVVTTAIRQELTSLLSTAIANLTEIQKSNATLVNNVILLSKLMESTLEDVKEVKKEARETKSTVHEEARDLADKVNEIQRSIDKLPFKRTE